MFKSKSRGKIKGWDTLIGEAQQRIQDLQSSIKIFERKKAAKEPCRLSYVESDTQLVGIAAEMEKTDSVPA